MTKDEYSKLFDLMTKSTEIRAKDIPGWNRILLEGVTTAGVSIRVSLVGRDLRAGFEGVLQLTWGGGVTEKRGSFLASTLHGRSKLFPEKTDYWFARLLTEAGETLDFFPYRG
jgi:hypothetical protein